jgi:hypothetical protein
MDKDLLNSFIDEKSELTYLLDKFSIEYKVIFEKSISRVEFEFIEVEFISKKASRIFFCNPGCSNTPYDNEKMKQVCSLLTKFYKNNRL